MVPAVSMNLSPTISMAKRRKCLSIDPLGHAKIDRPGRVRTDLQDQASAPLDHARIGQWARAIALQAHVRIGRRPPWDSDHRRLSR